MSKLIRIREDIRAKRQKRKRDKKDEKRVSMEII